MRAVEGSLGHSPKDEGKRKRPSVGITRVLARQGWAGEMSGLFEHPAWGAPVVLNVQVIKSYRAQ